MESALGLRRTPFYSLHKEMGARLVDFHGWELPIQFTSILKEHNAVRSHCGLFDVSHMGQILVSGPRSLEFLQKINSNNILLAKPGQAVYSHLLNDRGGIIDDVIVGCLARDRYLVVVNAGTREKDAAWFLRQSQGFDAVIEDKSGQFIMLALQGPHAEAVLSKLHPGAQALRRLGVLETELFGQYCVIQRSGYTGEDGFEIITSPLSAARLWQDLLSKGNSYGILPCGLGARDTLRLEAGYPLYGQDIDEDHSPLEANYGWVVKTDKGDFIGRDAILAQKKSGLKRKLAGIRLTQNGVPRAGCAVFHNGRRIGALTSATFSPSLQKGIGLGYFESPELPPGEKLEVEIHGNRASAEISALPFYKREKESGS